MSRLLGEDRSGGWRRWLRLIGPGVITGASDDDPSGISTYSVAGASTGLSMLWIALLTTPMMVVVQGMSARIALVSGTGLMGVVRAHYPRWLTWSVALLVVVANTANVGADIAGMAGSAQLVLPLPYLVWVMIFGAVLIAAQVFFSYRRLANALKWLTISLFAYIVTAFVVHPHWGTVALRTVIPEIHLDAVWLTTLVAVLGTTITPYLFFWQSDLEIEEQKAAGRTSLAAREGATTDEIRDMRVDVDLGMIFSNVVMFFIIVTCATAFFGTHKPIATAQEAADALRPLAGNFAGLLFALGMVGTGLLAIPAMAGSSAFVVAETMNFAAGLSEPVKRAPQFYGVIVTGMVIGIAMNVFHIDPVAALFWSAVLNGVAAVPLLIVMTLVANRRSIMGRWTNTRTANVWSVLTIVLMAGAAIGMFAFWGR